MRDSMGDGDGDSQGYGDSYGYGEYGQRLDARAVGRLVAEGGAADVADVGEAGEVGEACAADDTEDAPAAAEAADADDPTPLAARTAADLARLLSVAAGPPPGPGREPAADEAEERALAAFRAAAPDAAVAPVAAPRASALVRAVRRLGAARSAALALIVTALLGGGVAFAGGGLHLPSSPSPDRPAGDPSATGGASRDTEETGGGERDGGQRSRTPDGSSFGPTTSGSGTPDGQTTGGEADARVERQCRVYLRHPEHRRAKLLDTPAFEPLVSVAGGPGKVVAYCEAQGDGDADSGESGGAEWREGADRPGAGESGAPGDRAAVPSTPGPSSAPESPGRPDDFGASGSSDSGTSGTPAEGAPSEQ